MLLNKYITASPSIGSNFIRVRILLINQPNSCRYVRYLLFCRAWVWWSCFFCYQPQTNLHFRTYLLLWSPINHNCTAFTWKVKIFTTHVSYICFACRAELLWHQLMDCVCNRPNESQRAETEGLLLLLYGRWKKFTPILVLLKRSLHFICKVVDVILFYLWL